MNLKINKLKQGDLIEILAPAKAIEKKHILNAKKTLENHGFKVRVSKHCTGNSNYFSGTINERLEDFQRAIDDDNVKAILCARGGYGCIQIVEKIQWANMLRNPKWIIGFSDVTVFHQKLCLMGLKSIHGTMPLNFSTNSPESIKTLFNALTGKPYKICCRETKYNKEGQAEGFLHGGNLSVIYSLLSSLKDFNFSNSILFIEDVCEPIYHLDRMFYALKNAGILDRIKGLIVGGMTDLKDSNPPFGLSYEEVILSHFKYSKVPVCFDFPAGHLKNNQALVFGSEVVLNINQEGTELSFVGS